MDDTTLILVVFGGGALAIAIAMHFHFKNASDMRAALVSPQVYAVIGALLGISMGMIWFWGNDSAAWNGQIHLEQGALHAAVGAIGGGLAGMSARAIFANFPRMRVISFILTLVLLGASIGTPIGGIYGNIAGQQAVDTARMTLNGMIWGGVAGCAVGMVLGLLQVCCGSRPVATATEQMAPN
ncbi:MAG TPA: hypothetical protein VLM40_00435 [Gemmata sp.]|nr:hypothetical protein [Gemmata sp.]